jgi:hypothetical protein
MGFKEGCSSSLGMGFFLQINNIFQLFDKHFIFVSDVFVLILTLSLVQSILYTSFPIPCIGCAQLGWTVDQPSHS